MEMETNMLDINAHGKILNKPKPNYCLATYILCKTVLCGWGSLEPKSSRMTNMWDGLSQNEKQDFIVKITANRHSIIEEINKLGHMIDDNVSIVDEVSMYIRKIGSNKSDDLVINSIKELHDVLRERITK
jgi:hypothetical protein